MTMKPRKEKPSYDKSLRPVRQPRQLGDWASLLAIALFIGLWMLWPSAPAQIQEYPPLPEPTCAYGVLSPNSSAGNVLARFNDGPAGEDADTPFARLPVADTPPIPAPDLRLRQNCHHLLTQRTTCPTPWNYRQPLPFRSNSQFRRIKVSSCRSPNHCRMQASPLTHPPQPATTRLSPCPPVLCLTEMVLSNQFSSTASPPQRRPPTWHDGKPRCCSPTPPPTPPAP